MGATITMVLAEPMEGLDLPASMSLGPFDCITYENGCFKDGYGETIAEVFSETLDDMTANVFGHPAAGKIFVPRTFQESEHEHRDYPGKAFGTCSIVVTS